MKYCLVVVAAVVSSACAFAPLPFAITRQSTDLSLFGPAKKEGEEGGKGPMAGMAEQMEMFKKAQAIATKKKEIDAEVAKLDIKGSSENGKVSTTVKIVPGSNPMNPAPDFQVASIDFDDEFFESADAEELGNAAVEAIRDGEKKCIEGMNEKYAVLAGDLQTMMQK